jgi:hypothetical protein
MNHNEAVSAGSVERYLLGQLSASETQEFEEHFFDCVECAADLRAGAMFEDNARAVFLEQRAVAGLSPAQATRLAAAKPSFWASLFQNPWTMAPVLASVALAVIVAYQAAIVIPGLRGQLTAALSPQAVASHALAPLSRGDSRVLEVPAGGRFYTIYMDPTWDGSFTAYECSVLDESGSTRLSVRVPAPPPGEPVQILMARTLLPSGRYTVVVRNSADNGKPELELARYALILKLD